MMRNKVVLFDLDDTLYKEIDFLHSAYREIASEVEQKYSTGPVYPFMIEAWKERKDVFSELIHHWHLPMRKENLLMMYRTHRPNIRLDEEVRETLDALSRFCILGLITDGRSVTQRNKISALGLSKWMDEKDILISEEFGTEKPSLDNYAYFPKRYGESTYFYVGDNPRKDFVSPNRLGWETICVRDDGRNIHRQDFSLSQEFLPDHLVAHIKEVVDWVAG